MKMSSKVMLGLAVPFAMVAVSGTLTRHEV